MFHKRVVSLLSPPPPFIDTVLSSQEVFDFDDSGVDI
jgi:hypothetical protein